MSSGVEWVSSAVEWMSSAVQWMSSAVEWMSSVVSAQRSENAVDEQQSLIVAGKRDTTLTDSQCSE